MIESLAASSDRDVGEDESSPPDGIGLGLSGTVAEHEMLRAVAQIAADVVAFATPDRRLTWVSPTVTHFLGWSPEEILGIAMSDLIHPEDWAVAKRLRADLDSTGQETAATPAISMRLRARDGSYRWMSASTQRLYASSGALRWVAVALRDIDELVLARQEAQRRLEQLRSFMDSLLDPAVLLTAVRNGEGELLDFVCVEANAAAADFYAMTRGDLVGAGLTQLHSGSLKADLLDRFQTVLESGEPLVLDGFALQGSRGQPSRYFDVRAVRQGDGLSMTWRDTTDRTRALEALARSEQEYRLLAENATDIVLRGRRGRTLWVSPSVTASLGWAPQEWIGCPILDFVHQDDRADIVALMPAADDGHAMSFRTRLRAKGGRFHWVDVQVSAFVDQDGVQDGVVVIMRLADDAVIAEHVLEQRATHDQLTGLLNRAEAIRRLELALAGGMAIGAGGAVLFCDVDKFKEVNDTFGHAAGDLVLKVVAERIASTLGPEDILARMGGDELLVVLCGSEDSVRPTQVAREIQREARRPIDVGNGVYQGSVSIGVARLHPSDSADAAIARADAAMYEAKRAGRDRVVVEP